MIFRRKEEAEEGRPKNKILRRIKTIFTWAVVAIAVFMMIFTIVSVTTFDRADRSIFGLKAFIVQSDSMKATDFAAGDLVISRSVDPATLEEGDIITFQSIDPDSYGEIITHKIRRLTTDEDGNPAFITYGTTTDTDDRSMVTYSFVLGKYCFHLAGVGRFFQFLKTTPGYIVCILIPFLALILLQGIDSIRLFRRYRHEQMEALETERRQLASERLEQQKMMQELLSLREQMAATAKQEQPAAAATAAAEQGQAATADPSPAPTPPTDPPTDPPTTEPNQPVPAESPSPAMEEHRQAAEDTLAEGEEPPLSQ